MSFIIKIRNFRCDRGHTFQIDFDKPVICPHCNNVENPKLQHGDFGFDSHCGSAKISIGEDNKNYDSNGDYPYTTPECCVSNRKGNVFNLLSKCGKDGCVIALTGDEASKILLNCSPGYEPIDSLKAKIKQAMEIK